MFFKIANLYLFCENCLIFSELLKEEPIPSRWDRGRRGGAAQGRKFTQTFTGNTVKTECCSIAEVSHFAYSYISAKYEISRKMTKSKKKRKITYTGEVA